MAMLNNQMVQRRGQNMVLSLQISLKNGCQNHAPNPGELQIPKLQYLTPKSWGLSVAKFDYGYIFIAKFWIPWVTAAFSPTPWGNLWSSAVSWDHLTLRSRSWPSKSYKIFRPGLHNLGDGIPNLTKGYHQEKQDMPMPQLKMSGGCFLGFVQVFL